MVQFLCDACGKVKQREDAWILGLGVEQLGATSTIREVDILSTWSEAQARDILAVHFCSERCKDRYISKAFGTKIPA